MNRPFTADDNERTFKLLESGEYGRLEYPLEDPGTAEPGQGILWVPASGWYYVSPAQVEPAGRA